MVRAFSFLAADARNNYYGHTSDVACANDIARNGPNGNKIFNSKFLTQRLQRKQHEHQ